MAGTPERQSKTDEETNRIIRQHIVGIFNFNYQPFVEKKLSTQHLITIKYEIGKEQDISFYNQNQKLILPYGNLNELFEETIKPNLDTSIPPLEFKEFANLTQFSEMPNEFRRYVGERFWQKRKLYKHVSENPGERTMITRTRYYNPVGKDTMSPRFEIWMGERNKSDRASDEEMHFKFNLLVNSTG